MKKLLLIPISLFGGYYLAGVAFNIGKWFFGASDETLPHVKPFEVYKLWEFSLRDGPLGNAPIDLCMDYFVASIPFIYTAVFATALYFLFKHLLKW